MTAKELQQALIAYAKKNKLKIPSIGAGYHECPIPNIKGRTLYKVFRGEHVGVGSLSTLELFFKSQKDLENE